jgi:hypothetical protein
MSGRFQEVDLHDLVVGGEQVAQVAQALPPPTLGAGGVLFQGGDGMLLGDADHALQGTQDIDAALSQEALARMAEHGAKQMRPPSLAVRFDLGALAEVDLQFLAGGTLHPTGRQLRSRSGGFGSCPDTCFDLAVRARSRDTEASTPC